MRISIMITVGESDAHALRFVFVFWRGYSGLGFRDSGFIWLMFGCLGFGFRDEGLGASRFQGLGASCV